MALFQKGGKGKLILLAVAAAAVAGVVIWNLRGQEPAAKAPSLNYTTETVEKRTITRSLTGSGTLKPANSYTVTTLVKGEILSADFEEGDLVEKDQTLYTVDSSDTSNTIERSQISLDQARRNYNSAVDKQYVRSNGSGMVLSLNVKEGDTVKQGQTVATIRDSTVMTLKVPFPSDDALTFSVGQPAIITLDGSFETLTGTVREISGADTVSAGNMITRNVTIEVVNPGGLSDTQAATASVNGIGCAASGTFTYRFESTVTASSAGIVKSVLAPEGSAVVRDQVILTLGGKDMEDALQSAADSLRSAELSMENSQTQLKNYTITSPISGTIVDKQYKAGDTISGDNKTLCIIYDLSYLEMTLDVDELDISSVSVGQNVSITADAVPGKTFMGAVTKVSVAGTTSGGITSYPVTIRLDEPGALLPGMNVDAEILLDQVRDVLSIPNSAVVRGSLVLVTSDSPSAANSTGDAPEGYAYVKVETGISSDDYVEIKQGLQEGDTVAYISASGNAGSFPMMGGMPGGGRPGGGMGGGPMR